MGFDAGGGLQLKILDLVYAEAFGTYAKQFGDANMDTIYIGLGAGVKLWSPLHPPVDSLHWTTRPVPWVIGGTMLRALSLITGLLFSGSAFADRPEAGIMVGGTPLQPTDTAPAGGPLPPEAAIECRADSPPRV